MVAIFVLSSFILVLLVDHIVLKFRGKYHPAFEPESAIINFGKVRENDCDLPSNYLLSKGHTWLKNQGEGITEIGIDVLAAKALGGLSILKCAKENSVVKRGDVLFVGNYGSENVEFLSPIDCKVKQINYQIIGKKILTPYETWGIKVHSSENFEMGNKLFSGEEAIAWLKGEFQKLKIFLERQNADLELVGETMFDGGAVDISPNLQHSKKIVCGFKNEFLSL